VTVKIIRLKLLTGGWDLIAIQKIYNVMIPKDTRFKD